MTMDRSLNPSKVAWRLPQLLQSCGDENDQASFFRTVEFWEMEEILTLTYTFQVNYYGLSEEESFFIKEEKTGENGTLPLMAEGGV